MYIYELWDYFYNSRPVFCSTFEKAKAQAIAYLKNWGAKENIDPHELEDSIAEV